MVTIISQLINAILGTEQTTNLEPDMDSINQSVKDNVVYLVFAPSVSFTQ